MRFTHNNVNYEIDFEYSDGVEIQNHYPRKGVTIITVRDVRYTYAYVLERISPEKRRSVASGMSTCQPEDRFVKEVGRTQALRNACKYIQDQELRTKIFECYFNRSRDKQQ